LNNLNNLEILRSVVLLNTVSFKTFCPLLGMNIDLTDSSYRI